MPSLRLIFISIILCCSTVVHAQHLQWAVSAGDSSMDWGQSVVMDSVGNSISVGWVWDTADFDPGPATFFLPGPSAYIQKLDTNGNLLWAKAMQGARVGKVVLDKQGNIFITGSFNGTIDIDPGINTFFLTSSQIDIFLVKLDAAGNLLWAKNMGHVGNSLALDSAGNIYLTGSLQNTADFDPGPGVFNLSTGTAEDIVVLKLDPSGNFLWAKAIGSSGLDKGLDIAVDKTDGVYVAGTFTGLVDFDPGAGTFLLDVNTSSFILKLDTAGNFQWADTFTTCPLNTEVGIATDRFDNVVMTATSGFNNSAIFVKKWGSAGNLKWSRSAFALYSGAGHAIVVDDTGNVYSTGFFSGMVDFDPDPNTDYYLSTDIPGESWGPYVQKLDSAGNFKWAVAMAGAYASYSRGKGIAWHTNGDIVVTGHFDLMNDFDPGVGVVNLQSTHELDIFLARLSQQPCVVPPAPAAILFDSVVCEQEYVSFLVNTVAEANSYTWIYLGFPDITVDTAISLWANSSGYIGVAANNGCGSSDTISVYQIAIPLPNPVIIMTGNSLTVTALFTAYQWYLDNVAITGATNDNYTVSGYGSYHVEVMDTTGCSNKSNHITVTPVEVAELQQKTQLTIYPNPSHSAFTIKNTGREIAFSISDVAGRVISHGVLHKDDSHIDASSWQPGVYFLVAGEKRLRLLKL